MADYTIDGDGNIVQQHCCFGHPATVSFENRLGRQVTVTVYRAGGGPVGPGEGPFGKGSLEIPPAGCSETTIHGAAGIFTLQAGTGAATLNSACFSIRADGAFNPGEEVVQEEYVGGTINIFNESPDADRVVYVYEYVGDTPQLTSALLGYDRLSIARNARAENLPLLARGTYHLTSTWPPPRVGPIGPKDGKINVGGGL